MQTIPIEQLRIVMVVLLFISGLMAFFPGIFILLTRSASREVRALTTQTTLLAQKGLSEEVAGLVGNASSLVSAISDLIKTNAGIGVFLTTIGVSLMGLACYLIFNFETY